VARKCGNSVHSTQAHRVTMSHASSLEVFAMLKTRGRWMLLLALLALLVTGLPVVAQTATGNVLEPGVPQTGILNAEIVARSFIVESVTEEDGVLITVTSEPPATLGVIITYAEDGVVALMETGSSGTIDIGPVPMFGTSGLNVTVFNAGLPLTADTPFAIELTLPGAEPTAAPTAAVVETLAPETTVEAEAPSQVVLNQGISVTLSWPSTDDFDLEVRDPVGGSLYWETPTVASGGTISANANQQCVNVSPNARETATWSAGGVPTGSYEVLVYFQSSCNDGADASFQVDINVDGVPLDAVTATISPGDVYALAFEIAADGTAQLMSNGSVVNVNDLAAPASQILAAAQPIAVGSTVTGRLTNQDFFQSYAFDAAADVLYTISLEALSGSLDTLVQILDAQGRLVRVSDDREFGVTDSLLEGVLLPSAGTYTIVATRYAKSTGGTEGEYALTLSEADSGLPADFSDSLLPGSLQVLLVWNTPADLQLLVRDPSGDAVFDDVPQIASGGRLAAAGNVQCRVSEAAPFSYIYWPPEISPRAGSYEVEVWYQNPCGTAQPTTFNLYVLYQGQQVYAATEQLLPDERFLTSFTINADGTATPSAGGVIRGVQDIPYQPELTNAIPLAPGQTVTGSITPDNKFDLFSIEGTAGDVINIAMNATQGSLDPLLFVIGPSGEFIAQNDDAVAGENTNALIANLALPVDGTYIIIATHFGGPYGGTTGAYQLTFTQLN
jgi:uncharacterized protein YfaP (DUF2135 family)